MCSMRCFAACLVAASVVLAGCGSVAARNSLLAVGGTAQLGQTPSNTIKQVYYLGVFDPRDQLPPTIYRVRVQGQASALSATKFASGWVRAELVDSLSGQVEALGDDAKTRPDAANGSGVDVVDKGLLTGRRLIMFGPEGFREAPKNHRLVVVMGSNPDAFFSAVDQALGVVASVTQGAQAGPEIEKALWADLATVREQAQRLDILLDGAKNDYFPGG